MDTVPVPEAVSMGTSTLVQGSTSSLAASACASSSPWLARPLGHGVVEEGCA